MTSLSCSATPLPSLCSRHRSGGDSTVAAARSVKLFDKPKKVVCCCISPPPRDLDNDGFSSTKFNNLSSLSDEQVEPESDSDVLIECRDVYKSFGEKHILKGVSFKIRHGEAVGVIGPSGTGKSTILKIIAGLLAPDKFASGSLNGPIRY